MVVAALGLSLLAGCAAEQRWMYDRPGLTTARLDHDLESCRREAHRASWFPTSRSGRVDQGVVNRCMERKGYTARRDE